MALDGDELSPQELITFFWLFFTTVTVFWMQVGFALLEVGCSRVAHVKDILTKNVVDGAISILAFFAVGYALYGSSGNAFCGNKFWFLSRAQPGDAASEYLTYAQYLIATAFAASSVTIVSGAVAERCRLQAYFCMSCLLAAFIYPVAGHWVWSTTGWLSVYNRDGPFEGVPGFLDYAGGVVVHVLGGTAALTAVYWLGPRYGRFGMDGIVVELTGIVGNSSVFRVVGSLILFISFLTFNSASVGRAIRLPVASLIATNTAIGAASSCVSVILWKLFVRKFDMHFSHSIDGLLAGCVALTASGPFVEPWAAFVIGAVGGLLYEQTAEAMLWFKLDDVVNATAIHLTPGLWGAISVGLFANSRLIRAAYNGILEPDEDIDTGAFMGGSGKLLGVQLLGGFTIMAFCALCITPLLWMLYTLNWLRLSTETQISMHSGFRNVENATQLHEVWYASDKSKAKATAGNASGASNTLKPVSRAPNARVGRPSNAGGHGGNASATSFAAHPRPGDASNDGTAIARRQTDSEVFSDSRDRPAAKGQAHHRSFNSDMHVQRASYGQVELSLPPTSPAAPGQIGSGGSAATGAERLV